MSLRVNKVKLKKEKFSLSVLNAVNFFQLVIADSFKNERKYKVNTFGEGPNAEF